VTFVGFNFASEVLLGRLARFYGLSIPEGHNETSLADFVRARLTDNPTLGARISFGSVALVVGGMNGQHITRIGLDLQPASAAYLHERKLVTVRGI
jgi:NhaP-type Na+/H+ and K+/H+ antiporter